MSMTRLLTGGARNAFRLTDRFRRSLSPAGLALGGAAFAVSTRPTLIPRTPTVQGVVSGMASMAGYAVGAGLHGLVRDLGVRNPLPAKVDRWVGPLATGALVATAAVSLIKGAEGRRRTQQLWEIAETKEVGLEHSLPISLGMLAGSVVVGRGFLIAVRALTHRLASFLPVPIAATISVSAVGYAAWILVKEVFIEVLRLFITNTFIKKNASTKDGDIQPQVSERSGSPDSTQPWESLGYHGRIFVSQSPSRAEIEEFTGRPAKEPIRAYAGISSQTTQVRNVDFDALAASVVAELERTGAQDRKILVVVTTTGTGWVVEHSVAALEYLYGGDTAIAAMQYSVDPSWVQLFLDLETPRLAAKALFEAVHTWWSALPADNRPMLVPFGLSLGAYGSQTVYQDLADLEARTDGAVWAGTPRFTPFLHELTEQRDAGSFEIRPELTAHPGVRWGAESHGDQGLWANGVPEGPRVAYLQHPSDGVARWWWPAFWSHDDWYSEPIGHDVLEEIRWIPWISGVQVGFDLMTCGGAAVPLGHGHNYGEEFVDAWYWVGQPAGWDEESLQRLREHIGKIPR